MAEHVIILPQLLSSGEHHIVRLPHPRSGRESLFVVDQSSDALLEIQSVLASDHCWFKGEHVLSDGSLKISTKFDPIFLLLSFFGSLTTFSSYSDLFDQLSATPYSLSSSSAASPGDDIHSEYTMGDHTSALLRDLPCVRRRLTDVADSLSLEGLPLYRVSASLVLIQLRRKIDRLTHPTDGIFGPLLVSQLDSTATPTVTADVPSTKEERHSAERQQVQHFSSIKRYVQKTGTGDGNGLSIDQQIEIRRRSAIAIIGNYLSDSWIEKVMLSYDLAPVSTDSSKIVSAAESHILSSTYLPGRSSSFALGDPLSNKGGDGEDGGFGAAARDKARKLREGKGGRGVEALKKVNTKGMMKMTSFFTKKAAAPTHPAPVSVEAKAELVDTEIQG